MSGLKARLVKPTGLEFYDLAIAINTAIWNFVKFEFKNKASKDAGDKRKVVMKPCRASFSRMRRKLRSFHKFWIRGEMTMEQIHAAYISWYGFQSHMHAHKALRSANRYYNSLFGGAYVGLHG